MKILFIILLFPTISIAQNLYSPKGTNYEVSFFTAPKISETYSTDGNFERAEAVNNDCYLRVEGIATVELTKEETIEFLQEFAKLEGFANPTITYESSNLGNMGYLVGTKNMDTPNGNQNVKHLIKIYSKGNSCIVMYAILVSGKYSKEVQSFFISIKYK